MSPNVVVRPTTSRNPGRRGMVTIVPRKWSVFAVTARATSVKSCPTSRSVQAYSRWFGGTRSRLWRSRLPIPASSNPIRLSWTAIATSGILALHVQHIRLTGRIVFPADGRSSDSSRARRCDIARGTHYPSRSRRASSSSRLPRTAVWDEPWSRKRLLLQLCFYRTIVSMSLALDTSRPLRSVDELTHLVDAVSQAPLMKVRIRAVQGPR